jgi:two-component system, NtrC family, sensor histidine kinase HydH
VTSRLIVRMTAPLVAMSVSLLVVGVGAAWYVHHLQSRVSDELKANVSSLRAAEELVIALKEIRTLLENCLLTGDRKYLDAVLPLRATTEKWLAEAERWGTGANEQEMMKQARRGHKRFFLEMDQLASQPVASLNRKIRELIETVLVHEILQPTQNYLTLNAAESEASIKENEVFARWLIGGLLLLGICGSAAGLMTGFGFARAFQRSLVQLSLPIRAAAGHLDEVVGPVTFSSTADLREMESVLRMIAERIGAVVGRLRQSEREVLRSEQLAALGQMAAGMAHELRNPLTSMKILVQAALARGEGGGTRDETDTEYLASRPSPSLLALGGRDLIVLEEEITRLERLIQSYLQFAKPPQLEKRIVDIKPLVIQAVQFVTDRAALCATRIETALPAASVTAAVDGAQFRQVLLNLLLNALDATGSGGVVWVDLREDANDWLTLRISDNGTGLPAILGNQIFSPFVTTKETGLGLGLSICKRIIESHGGEIAAANRAEGGAAFTIRLPLPSCQLSAISSQAEAHG